MGPHVRTAKLAALPLLSLVLACTSDPDFTPSPRPSASAQMAPSFPLPSPTPSASEATFELDALTWLAVTQPFGGGGSQDVTTLFLNGFGELVAWGHDEDADDDSGATVPTFWSSGDGNSWRDTRLGSSGDNLIVVGVDHGPRGFVAVGFAGSSVATWWSPDGDAWSRATLEQPATDETTEMLAVAAGADGFLAVGSDLDHEAAWFSSRGETWTRVGPEFPTGRFWDVTHSRDGGFVVVGTDHSPEGWNGAAWVVSPDGQDWRPAKANREIAGPNADHLRRVWSFAGGYVAFGQERDPDNPDCLTCAFDRENWRMYTSPDGLTWKRHDLDFEPATGEPVLVEFTAIEPWADGLIAVGRGTDQQVRVWLSSDGITWAPVGNPVALGPLAATEPTVADLLVADRQLVIGGSLGSDGYLVIGSAP